MFTSGAFSTIVQFFSSRVPHHAFHQKYAPLRHSLKMQEYEVDMYKPISLVKLVCTCIVQVDHLGKNSNLSSYCYWSSRCPTCAYELTHNNITRPIHSAAH